MNKPRRKELESIKIAIIELKEQIEILQDEEEKCRDNIPENLQESERYENIATSCDNLFCAVSSLEEAVEYISESIE